MITAVTVREYARLTTAPVDAPSPDRAHISTTAFDWLVQFIGKLSSSGTNFIQFEDRNVLRIGNFVGVIETPCGTRLEILPKHWEEDVSPTRSRTLLQRMISAALDLPVRAVGETTLELFEAPLSEWVMSRFLEALDHLIKRGVRSDYIRIESEERYLRGQLDCVKQMRQPPGRQHVFQIRHDEYLPDRPENRLLKLALELVCHQTQIPANWRLAQELRTLLYEIPSSKNINKDFKEWRNDRLMAHYVPVKPWCELILSRQMPFSLVGSWHGISMLFPMEILFERYVAALLKKTLISDARVVSQASGKSLCEHNGSTIFRLRPDLMIECRNKRWILDTKWKLLSAEDRANNYNLSQADFYQLFAYGQKYLYGEGELVLIYPRHSGFREPLPVFEFSPGLRLWVVPFDLEMGCLVHRELTTLPFRPHLFA